MNVCMDTEAGEALDKAVENDEYIKTLLLHELLVMECGERRVTASATEVMYEWKSRQTAKLLYHKKGIVNEVHFDPIYWDGIKNVMITRFNNSFTTFYTKHVIGMISII